MRLPYPGFLLVGEQLISEQFQHFLQHRVGLAFQVVPGVGYFQGGQHTPVFQQQSTAGGCVALVCRGKSNRKSDFQDTSFKSVERNSPVKLRGLNLTVAPLQSE